MKKIINFVKSRAFIATLGLTFIALIIAGITYAWFTWNSTDNTNITMQIGEYTVVTFTEGNDINVNNLAPVYNYTDGESTTFTLTNSNDDVTKEFKYNVYLDITSISNELKTTQFKYVLLDSSNNIIDQGNFSSASDNSTLTITENQTLPNGNSSYTFIIYLDGNEQNNSNIMNKSLSGILRVTVMRDNVEPEYTPISDFTYAIGTFDYYETEDNLVDDIDIPAGEVLLVKYNGSDTIVNIPSTYSINGIDYIPIMYGNNTGAESTFYENENITEVNFANGVLFADLNNEASLNFNSMCELFAGCTSLVNVLTIPNTITNMSHTFYGCTSLVNVPTIPSSVTDMTFTFYGCTNLEGNIKINSSNISLASNSFANTVKNITLEIPSGSTTYNTFNGNVPGNVTISPFASE